MIQNGIPLPKHGRLGDLNEVASKIAKIDADYFNGDVETALGWCLWTCDKTQTVIDICMESEE